MKSNSSAGCGKAGGFAFIEMGFAIFSPYQVGEVRIEETKQEDSDAASNKRVNPLHERENNKHGDEPQIDTSCP